MGQVLHGRATTTAAVRRAIQPRQESLRALAKRCGIKQKTVGSGRSAVRLPICNRAEGGLSGISCMGVRLKISV